MRQIVNHIRNIRRGPTQKHGDTKKCTNYLDISVESLYKVYSFCDCSMHFH